MNDTFNVVLDEFNSYMYPSEDNTGYTYPEACAEIAAYCRKAVQSGYDRVGHKKQCLKWETESRLVNV